MKKVLFATTALIATAGVAAADVAFSGYGRFGAVYVDNGVIDSTDVASRFRLQADVSTETDNGLGFNARMRIQVEENSTNDSNGIRFGMTAGNFALNVGNINGVIESAPNLYLSTNSAGVGLEGNGFHSLATNIEATGSGFFNWTAYSSGGAGATNGVEAIYSVSGLTLHAHSTDDDYGIGASYTMAGFTGAIAYQEDDNAADDSILFVSVGGKFGAFNVALGYADVEFGGASFDKVSVKGGYDISAATNVYGFVASEDAGEAFGLGVSHDLGGASIDAGYTRTASDTDILSAGVFFRF